MPNYIMVPHALDSQGGKLRDAERCLDTLCQCLDPVWGQKRVAEFTGPKMAPNTSSPRHAGGIHSTLR